MRASPGVIAHESGHNLGLLHASSIACVPESLLDLAGFCGPVNEYGDEGDTMGDADRYRHFSTPNKFALQWLGQDRVVDVFASGKYVLNAAESSSSGPVALRIPIGRDVSGNEIAYWAELRSSGSVFSGDEGVQVRLCWACSAQAICTPSLPFPLNRFDREPGEDPEGRESALLSKARTQNTK